MVQCYQRWSRGNLAVIESLANFFEYIVTNTVTDLWKWLCEVFKCVSCRHTTLKLVELFATRRKKNLVGSSTLENLCMGTIARNKEDNVI